MTYDWQAELRNYLVRPNQDLSQGGQFSLRAGGSVTLRKGTNRASLNGDAQFNIDVIEVFTLRSAIASGGVSIEQKLNSPYGDRQFSYFTAAICDFHNIPHNYKPPRSHAGDYRDAWERVVGYLEEKYSEQPRPVLNISKAIHTKNSISKSLSWPVAIAFYLFVGIWIFAAMAGNGTQAFLILTGLFIALIVVLTLLVNLAGMTASFDLPKRLARFVLLTMTNKNPPDPPPSVPGGGTPPPPSDPPNGFDWLLGLDGQSDQVPVAPAPASQPVSPPAAPAPVPASHQVPTPAAPVPAPASPPVTPAAVVPVAESEVMTTTPMSRLTERQQTILRELESLVTLMDNAFKIPIINRTFGVDPLLGMVWGLGGVASIAPAGYIIFRALELGIPIDKVITMIRNVAVDTAIGVVPVAGQLSDFIIKANTANLNIIYEHFGLPPYKKRR